MLFYSCIPTYVLFVYHTVCIIGDIFTIIDVPVILTSWVQGKHLEYRNDHCPGVFQFIIKIVEESMENDIIYV